MYLTIVEQEVRIAAQVAPQTNEVTSNALESFAVRIARRRGHRSDQSTQLFGASHRVTPTPMPQLPAQTRRVRLKRATLFRSGIKDATRPSICSIGRSRMLM